MSFADIITGNAINNSPLNNSKSKAAYSFGKSERFAHKGPLMNSAGLMYKLPEVWNNHRSASIGYGNRNNLTKNICTGSVPYYDMPSDFDLKKKHAHIYTFGIAREYYKKV